MSSATATSRQPVTTKVDDATAKKHVQEIAGSYFNSRGIRSNFLHMLDLIGPIAIGPDKDGKLSAPMVTNTGNKPRRWVEIEPYVWKDVDSGEKLAAKVENGKINRWSFTPSPFMMFTVRPHKDGMAAPAPFARSAHAASALPGRQVPSPGSASRSRCCSRVAACATSNLARLAVADTGNHLRLAHVRHRYFSSHLLGGPLDPPLITLEVLTPIAFTGLLPLAGWNLRQSWVGAGWFSRRGRW
jgi:hypothetical protein